MSDRKIIYLDDAIDAIKSEQAYYAPEDGPELFFEYSHAIKALKNLPPAQPKWITCGERLPKEDGRYLITEKGVFGDYLYVGIANYGVPCMPMNKGKGRGWYITDSEGDYYCDMNHVLAWMPLPEPY